MSEKQKCPLCGEFLNLISLDGSVIFEYWCSTTVKFTDEYQRSHYTKDSQGDGYVIDWIVYPYRIATFSS